MKRYLCTVTMILNKIAMMYTKQSENPKNNIKQMQIFNENPRDASMYCEKKKNKQHKRKKQKKAD